ncbi:hypothetical protein B0A55_11842 [Friedmanniomyces simplex]|uniref:G domain-containing protein n=1 Tax=Friedmanniomyces simplex TaxID=329884 RepID=A0A4U0WG67_9PEZI|nr:hypothetical protein B0A55_11842 [Friedmanniomyces simplex]
MASEDIKTEGLDLGAVDHGAPTPHSYTTEALQVERLQDVERPFTPFNTDADTPDFAAATPQLHIADTLLTHCDSDEEGLFVINGTVAEPSDASGTVPAHQAQYRDADIAAFSAPANDVVDSSTIPDAAAPRQLSPKPVSSAGNKRVKVENEAGPQPKPRKKHREDARVASYDDNTEKETSHLAVDQPCFKAAEKLVPLVCDKILIKHEALLGRGYYDREIEAICTKFKDLRYVCKAYPGASIVGFLGDTAAGKSSLINCLLNRENIVGENDDGDSGTSVPQELAMADVDQMESIKVVVHYCPQRKVDALVKQYSQDIYEYDSTDKSELDGEELKTLSMKYHTALGFFTTLLCGREEFRTLEAAALFFARAQSDTDEDVLDAAKGYVYEYIQTLDRTDGCTTIVGNTMSAVNHQLKPYRGPVRAQAGGLPIASPWPLVRKITTHLKARILSEGLVLADLPGTSDTNRQRVQHTRDYLRQCDTIIIPHPILRIQSQDSVWANVMECILGDKQHSTILVATKTDDMKHGRESESVSSKDQAILDGFKAWYDSIVKEVADLEERLQDSEDEEEVDYSSLNRALKKKRVEKAEAEARWMEEGILLRNRRNAAGLKTKYKTYTRSNVDLPVFCVSNLVYQRHMHGYDHTEPPQLSLEATDIPRLRQHLFEIPAQRKLAGLMKLCKKDLPRVLLAMEMQCSKTKLERKREVEKKVIKPLEEFSDLMAVVQLKLKQLFEEMLQGVVDSHENEWRSEAKKHHESWVKYKYNRYAAFCRRSGQWKSPSKENIDWNVQISLVVEEHLLEGFTQFKPTLNVVRDSMRQRLDEVLAQLDTDLKESPQLMGMTDTLKGFHTLIELTRTSVNEETTKMFRDLEKILSVIRYNITSIETDDSYLMTKMAVTYEAAKARLKQGGHGTFLELKNLISKKLYGVDNVFLEIVQSATQAFAQEVEGWHGKLQERIGKELHGIVRDFNNRFDDVEVEDQTKREFRRELLATVKEAMGVMETEMEEALGMCAAYG